MQTRLFRIIRRIIVNIQTEFNLVKQFSASSFFFLFTGFIIGNLFGTFLSTIRNFIAWDGAILFILVVFFELLGKAIYTRSKKKKITQIYKWLNCWKIGILLGFFIDAFKVGS